MNMWKLKAQGLVPMNAEAGGATGSGAGGDGADTPPKNSGGQAEAGATSQNNDLPDWAKDPQRAVEAKRTVDAEAKAHRERAEAAEAKLKALEEQALQEQGNFKELYEGAKAEAETLKAEKVTFEKYQTAFKEIVAARLKTVPAHIRELLDGRDPLDQLKWLEKNAAAVAPQVEPDLDGGKRPSGKGRDYLGSEEHIASARKRFRLGR